MLPSILFVTLLLGGARGLDRFFFSQCECPNGQFFSVENTGEVSRFDLSAQNGAIDCPVTERGIVKDFDAEGVVASIDGSITSSFFNNNGRVNWFGVLEIDFNNLLFPVADIVAQTFDVLTMNFDTALTLSFTTGSLGGVSPTLQIDFGNAGFFASGVDTDLITVFFGETIVDAGAGGLFSGIFVCVGGSDGVMDQCNTNFVGAVNSPAVNNDVTVNLAADTPQGAFGNYRVRSMMFETEVAGLDQTDISTTIANTVLSNAAFDVSDGELPVFNGFVNDNAVEDEDLANINLNDFLDGPNVPLTFSVSNDPLVVIRDGASIATLTGLNAGTGIFSTFSPEDEIFGEATFSFSYTSNFDYTCVLTVDATINITSVEDVPTLISVANQQSIAFVNRPFAVEVATTIDNPDSEAQNGEGTLLDGFVRVETPPSAGDLSENNNGVCTGNALPAAVPLVNGEFRFCYLGREENVEGNQDSFAISVRPSSNLEANQAVGTTTITLLGGNPVVPNPNVASRSQFFTEATTGTIQVLELADAQDPARNVFGVLNNLADPTFVFKIQVRDVPPATVGELQLNDGTPIQPNDIFNRDDTFRFVPAEDPNFFNSNAEGTELNDAGVDLFGQGCAQNEKIGGVCPDTSFTYRVLFGDTDVPSEVFNFGIVVQAVDDGEATFSAEQSEAIIANSNNARNDIITVNGADLQVSSDNNQNVFNIGVRFVGVGGVRIGLPISQLGDPVGFDGDTSLDNRDCISKTCATMNLIGTPGQLNAFLDKVEFNIPVVEDGAPPRVDVTLASGPGIIFNQFRDDDSLYDANTLVSVEFDVQAIEEGFFDDVTNVAIVAGSAGGFMLIVLVAVIVRATTVNSVNGEKVKRLSETGPKKFKQRGGIAASKEPKRRRSFEDSDGEDEEAPPSKKGAPPKADDLLDWEKHIDPKTKQPFYHNTRTKETVWELPEGL